MQNFFPHLSLPNISLPQFKQNFGLFLFVAIPLPGTGAWTGALIASLFRMKIKDSLPCIFLGVIVAGLIMSLISFGMIKQIMGIF